MSVPRKSRLLWGVAAVMGGAVLLTSFVIFGTGHDEADLPEMDLTQAHPRVAAAIRAAVEDVNADPASGARWGELGMLLMAHHLRAQALHCFREAQGREPGDMRWVYYAGVLLEEIDFEAAVAEYERAIRLRPDYLPLRHRLGRLLVRLDRPDAAEAQFQEITRPGPQDSLGWLALGRLSLLRGDLAAAHDRLTKAASQPGPHRRTALVELARLHQRQGNEDDALRAQHAAARLPDLSAIVPHDPLLRDVESREVLLRQAANTADLLAARGDFPAAERAYRQLAQERPDLARPLLNLAGLLEMQGRTAEALAAYRDLVRRHPDDPTGHFGLALALEQSGARSEAIGHYRRCVALKPDHAPAHFNLGLLLEEQGDDRAAREAFARAVDADPHHAPAHLALGVQLQRSGQLEEALVHLRSAVRLAPGDPIPQSYLQRALAEPSPDSSEGPPSQE
ncbi:MAG: tetratricopeptide repeat protein [Planctomycetaceae bacterium]